MGLGFSTKMSVVEACRMTEGAGLGSRVEFRDPDSMNPGGYLDGGIGTILSSGGMYEPRSVESIALELCDGGAARYRKSCRVRDGLL